MCARRGKKKIGGIMNNPVNFILRIYVIYTVTTQKGHTMIYAMYDPSEFANSDELEIPPAEELTPEELQEIYNA